MKSVRVSLGKRSYDVVVGGGLLDRCGRTIASLGVGTDAVVVTNRRLRSLYGRRLERSLTRAGISARFETVPDSERAKSIAVAAKLIGRIGAYDVGRKIFVIAFGGGVIGDLAGFVAAVYKRGIPYIQIPTTLLAQVDSSIGGKVAVDLPAAKNLVGAFHQPRIVLADVSLISSLDRRQIRSGLSEVIKYGVICDKRLFSYLEAKIGSILRRDPAALEHVIFRSAAIKARIVARDEYDRTGVRAILNYGHTAGHAIEAAILYSGRYNHGEAIAIGMVTAAGMACALGLLSRSSASRIEALLKRSGLPVTARGVRPDAVFKAHLHDKKFAGPTNRFVLPTSIGRARVVENIPVSIIRNALKERIA